MEREHRPCMIGRNRIAVGRKFNLAIAIEPHGPRDRIIEYHRWQGAEEWLLRLPGGPDADRCSRDTAGIIPYTRGQELGVEFGKGGDLWERHKILTPDPADPLFNPPFLMRCMGGTEVGGEEVVTAKAGEDILFMACRTAQDSPHSGGEIVITEPMRDPTEKLKGGLMACQKTLWRCVGKAITKVRREWHKVIT